MKYLKNVLLSFFLTFLSFTFFYKLVSASDLNTLVSTSNLQSASNNNPKANPKTINPIYVVSDNTWKYNYSFISGWLSKNFDDSTWLTTVAPSSGLCPGGIDPILPIGRITDNGALPMWTQSPIEFSTVYFRKEFKLNHPTKGFVRVLFDDDGEVYVNGNLVLVSNNGFVEGVQYVDVSQYLVNGLNIVSLKGTDVVGGCQSVQFELTINPPFVDNFSLSTLNTNLWEFISSDSGIYQLDGNNLVVPGGGSMFYIRSRYNPFPTSGPFTAEFGMQYTTVDESGNGVAVGFQQQNGYDPSNVPIAFWQGNNFGLQVVSFGLTQSIIGSNPDIGYHVGKIQYDGTKYMVYLDGVLKYTSTSMSTAKSLWFGNPFCCRTNWSGFNLDYIKVTTP